MNRLRLCMISGSFEYESDRSLMEFGRFLQEEGGVQITMISYRNEEDDPSLEPIETSDVVLLFTRRLRTQGRELERFRQYCAAGGALVGVRTASHGYQHWLEFDREVLGGNYQNHYGEGPMVRVSAMPSAQSHPILRDFEPLGSFGSLYRNTPIASDAALLLMGRTDQLAEPVAWTRQHNGGRVFYTSLGHPRDFRTGGFLRLLANAVFWVGGRL